MTGKVFFKDSCAVFVAAKEWKQERVAFPNGACWGKP